VAALIVVLGCSTTGIGIQTVRVSDVRTESIDVELEDAAEVRVDLRMGGGEMQIDGGAEALMEADFAYNVTVWEPEVSYRVTDGEGRLTVRQPNTDQIAITRDTRYEWDLRFSDAVPLDMRIDSGAGEYDIDLAGLNVTALDMKIGAGDVTINLSDNPQLEGLEFDIGAGSAAIDLNGEWTQDLSVDVQGGVGETTLLLPRNVGVRIDVTRGIGEIDAAGLTRDEGAWVNDAYGESDVTLDIRIQAGIGRIVLDVRD
jgi:hypothetical protein